MTDTNEIEALVEELNMLEDPNYRKMNGKVTTHLQRNLIILKIKKLAENKDLDAMSWFAHALIWGRCDISQDVLSGFKIMKEAADIGHATSCVYLIEYHQGNWPEINCVEYPRSKIELMKYINIGAEKNDDYCLWHLYMLYTYTRAQPDSEKAINCLKKLEGSNFPPALLYTGFAHEHGQIDGKESNKKAYKCYKKALDILEGEKAHLYEDSVFHRQFGIDSAEVKGRLSLLIGCLLYKGSGVEKDTEKGLSYIIDAASEGYEPAQYWLKNPPVKLSRKEKNKVKKAIELPTNIPEIFKNDQKDWEEEGKVHLPVSGSAEQEQEDIEHALSALNNLIGLRNVKQQFKQLINVSIANRRRDEHGLLRVPLTLHCVFTGPPGTGKTTAARLYGEMLYRLGFLDEGHVVEVDRYNLVGEYIGQTAIRTKRIIESAKNGVLFIDEAYSLYTDSSRDFGPEAIATLLKEMEDSRNNLVVIMAGYKEPMDKLINSNEGLKSRFTNYIDFESYNEKELVQIFEYFCEAHSFSLTDEAKQMLEVIVKRAYQKGEYNRSNGRGIRTFFEQTLAKQCQRVIDQNIDSKDEMNIIVPEDLYIPHECSIDNVTYLSDRDR